MRRLTLLLATLLLALLPGAPGIAAPAKPAAATAKPAPRPAPKPVVLPDTPEIAELRRAFRFAFPIYEVMRTRTVQLARARAAGLPDATNFILPRLTLADATTRDITTPNNDTLYGSAWLDLSAGPVILDVPALPGRYNSAALMSIETDNVAILGTRTGGQGGRYAIVGPGWTERAPEGTELIRSASNDAWLLIRVLVNGPDDIAAAVTALGSFKLGREGDSSWAALVPTMPAPADPDGATFVAVVNEALARSATNPTLAARVARFAGQGIGAPGSPDAAALWAKYLPALRAELKSGLSAAGDAVNGWSYPGAAIGDYGDNDDLRSLVALGGLAALPRIEALYLTARTDAAGTPLDGSKAWRLVLPPAIPVGAFWSLTMYQQEADGRLFYVPNPLDRFAVGDRSRHLRANRDGSLEIFIQSSQPSGERVVNWLPAPKGRFVLVWRGYLPRAPLLDGSFRLPPVEAGELIP